MTSQAATPGPVVIDGFYPKTGTREGAEYLLTQLVPLSLVRNLPPTPCFVHREDAKPPAFRDGTLEAEFLDVNGTKVLRVFLLAIHSHLYYGFYHPSHLEQK